MEQIDQERAVQLAENFFACLSQESAENACSPTAPRDTANEGSSDVPPLSRRRKLSRQDYDRKWAAEQMEITKRYDLRDIHSRLSTTEQDLIHHALAGGNPESIIAVCRLAIILGHHHRKRDRDRKSDRKRRTLVGARLPRTTAERVRQAAETEHVSVYRWTEQVVQEALTKAGK